MKGFIKKIDLLLCALFMLIFSLHAFPLLSSRLLTYDEADYAIAASKGIIANYLDKNSISFKSFIEKGVSAFFFKKHSQVSKEIRDREDVAFYRHFHPPFFLYPSCIFIKIFGDKELSYRLGSFLAVLFLIPFVYLMTLYLGDRWVSCIAGFLISISPVLRQVSVLFLPHALYAFFSILVLFLIMLLVRNENTKLFYFTAGILGISFLTHEYSWVLLFTLILALLIKKSRFFSVEKEGIKASWRLFLFFLVLGGVYFLLWPAGVVKLGILKEYMFHTYNAILKRGMWKSMGVLKTFETLLKLFFVETLLLILSFLYGVYLLVKRRIDFYFIPLFLYILIFIFLYALRAPPGLTYISSCYPPLYIIAGVVISKSVRKLLKGWLGPILAGVVCLIVLLSNIAFFKKPLYGKNFLRPAISHLRKKMRRGERVLVSFGCLPTLHFYLRDKDVNMDMVRLSDSYEYINNRLLSYADYFVFAGKKDSLEKTSIFEVLEEYFEITKQYKYNGRDVVIYKKVKE